MFYTNNRTQPLHRAEYCAYPRLFLPRGNGGAKEYYQVIYLPWKRYKRNSERYVYMKVVQDLKSLIFLIAF